MNNFESLQHSRLITVIRTLADVLDNCTDGLSSQFAATALLLLMITLYAVADLLENCPDSLTLYAARLGRK